MSNEVAVVAECRSPQPHPRLVLMPICV